MEGVVLVGFVVVSPGHLVNIALGQVFSAVVMMLVRIGLLGCVLALVFLMLLMLRAVVLGLSACLAVVALIMVMWVSLMVTSLSAVWAVGVQLLMHMLLVAMGWLVLGSSVMGRIILG
jgi:hypothetical protein